MSDGGREDVLLLPVGAKRPRVCIFAAYDDTYEPLAVIVRENWRKYAQGHGYAIRFYTKGFHLNLDQPSTYGDKGRFQWYFDLKGHCEIVMYLDVDALFTNFHTTIENVLGSRNFWYTYDQNGPCSGVWIARTDDTTEKHLRYAYEYAAANNNVRNGVIEPCGLSDQDAFRALMHVPPFNQTFGPQNCCEAVTYGHCSEKTWYPGAWIVQFGGLPFEEKKRRLLEWSLR